MEQNPKIFQHSFLWCIATFEKNTHECITNCFRWDAIWKAAEARGDKEVCFTTEFGPPNYQVCDPKSELPLAKVWVSLKYD